MYASTRAEELAVTGWDDATMAAFIAHQFAAQHTHYMSNYEGASYDVILVHGEPAGRLYVARWGGEIRVMDVALLPAHRGKGIGSFLLESILAEAAASKRKVSVHVERANPAMTLYRRLGFELVEEKEVYVLMEWAPPD